MRTNIEYERKSDLAPYTMISNILVVSVDSRNAFAFDRKQISFHL